MACNPMDISKILLDSDVTSCIVRELSFQEESNKILNKDIDVTHLPSASQPPFPVSFIFEVTRASESMPKYLTTSRILGTYSELEEEPNWTRGFSEEGADYRWLLIFKLSDKPPFLNNKPYKMEFPNIKCGAFQIKDDPLDNRLGVDLELLYEDLQLIISHRPDWASVPAGQLKTDFAKAVLARLLEQTARPEQSNSEHSEVGRQAAE